MAATPARVRRLIASMSTTERLERLIADIMATDTFLGEQSALRARMLTDSIKDLSGRVVTLMEDLSRTESGKLRGARINLRQAQQIHKEIIREFEATYGVTVGEVITGFDEITQYIENSYYRLGEAAKFTGVNQTMLNALKNETYDQFMQFGTDAQNRIAREMYNQVVAGGSYRMLKDTIVGIFTGHTDVRGRPMTTYADTYARDAIMNFHNRVNLAKAEELGFEKFLYVGNVIEASRPFCIARAGKVFTRREIDSWDRQSWQGKAGPAYTHRGGYNCRHHWRPIRDEWFDDMDLDEVQEQINAAPRIAKVKMSSSIDEGKLFLSFPDLGAKKSFTLPEIGDVAAIKKITKEAMDWAKMQGATVGQVNAVRKKLTDAGYKTRAVAGGKKPPIVKPTAPKPKPKPAAPKKPPVVAPPPPPPVTGTGALTPKEAKKLEEYRSRLADQKARVAAIIEKRDIGGGITELEKDELTKLRKAIYGVEKRIEKLEIKAGMSPAAPVIETPSAATYSSESRLADMGIHDVVDFSEKPFADWDRHVLKPIADETDRLIKRSPLLGEALSENPVTHMKVLNADDLAKLGMSDAGGIHGGTRMAISGRGSTFLRIESKIKLGSSVSTVSSGASGASGVGRIPITTFRHELGHHVHKELLLRNRTWRSMDMYSKWDDLWKAKGSKWFKKNVSNYAGTNVREAFAESWNAYMSPAYKKGMLPKEIENFFEEMLSGKSKPVVIDIPKSVKFKKAAEVKLTTNQQNAISFAAQNGKWNERRVREVAAILDISEDEMVQLIAKFRDECQVAMRRQMRHSTASSYMDVFENGIFKNQFVLGRDATSSGCLAPYKNGPRDGWEKYITNGAFHKNQAYYSASRYLPANLAKERPIYGFIRDPANPLSANQYGEVEFILHEKFKRAVTITSGNSSAVSSLGEQLGTLEDSYPALKRMAQALKYEGKTGRYVREMIAGGRPIGGWAKRSYSYVESQIYGGIDLARGDVVKIVINRGSHEFGGGAEHIERLAKKYNIPVEYVDYGR